ncbi:hypothetical protein AB205_0170210, partial [Aquarana catesbeiana]
MLGLAGVSELKPDLDHLLRKEQHLERAYRKLLEYVQQHARESAVETPEIDVPKPEVLTTGQSSANLCTAPIVASAFLREERVQDLCPTLLEIPETGDLIDVSEEEEPPSKPPAEVLATGQRVQDFCPTPAAIVGAQGEEVAVYRELQIRIQGENAVVTSQLQLDLVSVDGPVVSTDRKPAEVLATGQNATNLYPTPATVAEFQGAGAVGLSPQQLAGADDVGKLLRPAELLATEQSAAVLCPPLTNVVFPVKVDGRQSPPVYPRDGGQLAQIPNSMT